MTNVDKIIPAVKKISDLDIKEDWALYYMLGFTS